MIYIGIVLFSGIHASLALMLHCHYLKESLHVNFSRKALQYIGDFGIVGFASGTALTLFYLFLEIYYRAGEYWCLNEFGKEIYYKTFSY